MHGNCIKLCQSMDLFVKELMEDKSEPHTKTDKKSQESRPYA